MPFILGVVNAECRIFIVMLNVSMLCDIYDGKCLFFIVMLNVSMLCDIYDGVYFLLLC